MEDAVCKEVIQQIWQLKADLESKLGPPEVCLDRANTDLAKAADQMVAWKTIATWVKGRLDLNEALIEEICTLDNCKDRLFALYIFFFELLPAHRQLWESPSKLPPKLKDPEDAYCASACSAKSPGESKIKLCGYPWLISADDYNCKLADLWQIWRSAGEAQAEAKCKFEQVAKCREQYEAASNAKAKREAARDALRRHDQKSCPPPKAPNHNDSPSQQPHV